MKLTEIQIRKIAEARGGTLDAIWLQGKNRMATLICEKDHVWNIRISNGMKWCKICEKNILSDLVAKRNEGKCLSDYAPARGPMTWECKKKHTWQATYNSVDQGSWCPKCYKLTITPTKKYIDDLAASNGGKCLSTYSHSDSPLLWECKKEHQWYARYHHVLNGRWCGECHRLSMYLSREVIDKAATDKGGKCLSNYINALELMTWECAKGHQWESKYNDVQQGHWCPECNRLSKYVSQETVNKAAVDRKGKCLSIYVGHEVPVQWECSKGHQWAARYYNIARGTWCPYCPNKNEQYCRDVLESIFNIKFTRIRPEWLTNDDGNKLELDGYNEDLKLAFEYNGIHHYEVATFWNLNEDDLAKQKAHDEIKVQKCIDREITLIVIPYTVGGRRNIRNFILDELSNKLSMMVSDLDISDDLKLGVLNN